MKATVPERPRYTPATILVVDDERNVTESLRVLLERQSYSVLSAHSAQEALLLLDRSPIDVVVSDEQMPGMAGSEFLHLVAKRFPATARILLTGKATLDIALRAVNLGRVSRILRKPCPPDEVAAAIREAVAASVSAAATERLLQVARGESSPAGSGPIAPSGRLPAVPTPRHPFGDLDAAKLETLSPRELEVLTLFLDGYRTSQIAKVLFVSPHTARNHLKAIFRKLEVHSQAELLSRSRRVALP